MVSGDNERGRFEPNEAPFDMERGRGGSAPFPPASIPPPAAPAPPRSLGSSAHDDLGQRPRTAPDNAEWDLKAYAQSAAFYERRASRLTSVVIVLTVVTAGVGGSTALLDEAVLGLATSALAASVTGIETWRAFKKPERQALAYRTGYVEIDGELDLYHNNAGAYGVVAEGDKDSSDPAAGKRALLAERLDSINRRTEDATR